MTQRHADEKHFLFLIFISFYFSYIVFNIHCETNEWQRSPFRWRCTAGVQPVMTNLSLVVVVRLKNRRRRIEPIVSKCY